MILFETFQGHFRIVLLLKNTFFALMVYQALRVYVLCYRITIVKEDNLKEKRNSHLIMGIQNYIIPSFKI